MSSGHKTMTAFLTVLCALILALVGLLTAWPRWAWPLLVVLLPTGSLVVGRALAPGKDRSQVTLPPQDLVPIPPIRRQEQTIVDVALPSALDDYDFVFSATVRWDELESMDGAPRINPGGLAVEAVVERARAITVLERPQRSALLQHQLNGALGIMLPDKDGRVLAMADGISLALSPRDQERLDKLAKVRKDEDVWKHERKYEIDRRSYLGDDVLKDPGSAVVWWLAKNNDHVEATVDRIGVLAQLAAAANNSEVPEEFRHFVPRPPEPEAALLPMLEDADGSALVPPQPGSHRLDGASVGEYVNALLHAADVPDEAAMDYARRIAAILEADGRTDAAASVLRRFTAAPEGPADDTARDPYVDGPADRPLDDLEPNG